MDIIDIAIQNAHISARAKQKALQAKARKTDKTRRERAKVANIRDNIDRPSAWKSSVTKRVHFGIYTAAKFQQSKPLQSILKNPIE